jgi:hypothetical protein
MKARANNTQKIFSSKGERTVSNLALVADPAQESDPFRQFISEWLDAGRADGLSQRTLRITTTRYINTGGGAPTTPATPTRAASTPRVSPAKKPETTPSICAIAKKSGGAN